MNKINWTKAVNIILFICTIALVLTAMTAGSEGSREALEARQQGGFGELHGVVGFLFVAFAVIHILQHWKWVKVNFFKTGRE